MYWFGTYTVKINNGKSIKIGFFDRFILKNIYHKDDFQNYLFEKYKRRKKRQKPIYILTRIDEDY